MTMTETSHGQMAVIYTRVSDPRQKTLGDGLRSQQARCREFATYRNYEVAQVFEDDMTGGSIKRPGLNEMLTFLRSHRKERPIVIIDDITRFARDIVSHWTLRDMIRDAGGQLESPSMQFGESSDAILHENMMASMAQHQRQKNAEQTKNRMRGRLLNGYWVFHAPVGYRFERVSGHNKLLVPDEPLASIVREALEGYATGRFVTQAEVQRYLESQPEFPKVGKKQIVRPMTVSRLLKQTLYAGMIEHPPWEISIRNGQHEGLISFACFQHIQERLAGKVVTPKRRDIHQDFPLRGAVACCGCERPLTAAWSMGKYKRYAYYVCQNKDCSCYGKSIRKADIERDFAVLLSTLTPSKNLYALMRDIFTNTWNQRDQRRKETEKAALSELKATQKQIDTLLVRILDAQSPTVISAYEDRIDALEKQKLVLRERMDQSRSGADTFEDKLELSMRFLRNPLRLWNSGNLEWQRTVLKLTFADHLIYCRNSGYRTPNLSMPFKVLRSFSDAKKQMVGLQIEDSNTLVNVLEEWNSQLEEIDFDQLEDLPLAS